MAAFRRDGRAADGTGLENQQHASVRGFKSLSLRSMKGDTAGVRRTMSMIRRKWAIALLVLLGPPGARQVGAEKPPPPVSRQLRHRAAVYSLALAPDGKTVATGSHDHAIHLWDVN